LCMCDQTGQMYTSTDTLRLLMPDIDIQVCGAGSVPTPTF
jgi:hypothetical protein